MIKITRQFLLCFSALGMLTACGGGGMSQVGLGTEKGQVAAVLERAALKASGHQEAAHLASVYQRNPNDLGAAIAYAKALRQAGRLEPAGEVLRRFATGQDGAPNAQAEYAAVQILNGNYSSAEYYAGQAVKKDARNYEAIHYLAIAQDLQGKHGAAHANFNTALSNWDSGAPTPVMNNLALNLALQGRVGEAVDMIASAAAMAPGRRDIENNFRVIHGLKNAKRNASYYSPDAKQTKHANRKAPPVPGKKPV